MMKAKTQSIASADGHLRSSANVGINANRAGFVIWRCLCNWHTIGKSRIT